MKKILICTVLLFTAVALAQPTAEQIVKRVGDEFGVDFGLLDIPDVPVGKVVLATSFDSTHITYERVITRQLNGGSVTVEQTTGPDPYLGANLTYTAGDIPLTTTDVLATLVFQCRKQTGAAGVGITATVTTFAEDQITELESEVINLDTVRIRPRTVRWLIKFLSNLY